MSGGVGPGEFIRRMAQVVSIGAAVLSVSPALADGAADGSLNLVLDQARLVKLPERVATIVIGNPLIADVSLQPGGLLVMTGKGYGTTNFIALDRKGNALLEKKVQVRGADLGNVVVYKGVNRETYSCTPICQPRVTPGDFQQFFTQSLAQTTARSTQASAMSSR